MTLTQRLRKLFRPAPPPPPFDPGHIQDEWFRSHFIYAADVVRDWLIPAGDFTRLRLLDFGCGDGITGLGLVLRHGLGRLVGVDLHPAHEHLARQAREQIGLADLPERLEFHQQTAGSPLAGRLEVDAIMSWSVFEHVDRALLPDILTDLFALLPSGGLFFLQIEPLYLSPHGSHLAAFLPEPWAHLRMDAAELEARVRAMTPEEASGLQKDLAYNLNSFNGYKEFMLSEYRTLNRLTADELVAACVRAGFTLERQERGNIDLPIPSGLDAYLPEQLRNNEIRLLLGKPR